MCQGKVKVKLTSLPQEFRQARLNKIIQTSLFIIEGKKSNTIVIRYLINYLKMVSLDFRGILQSLMIWCNAENE